MDKKRAKIILFEVADIIERNNITFFLSHATCLGAYREHDFIDTDTDIDLKIKAEDLLPKFKFLVNEFEHAGFKVSTGNSTLSFLNEIVLRSKPYNLDITTLFLVKGERWIPGRKATAFPAHLFENPKQIEFLGRKFYVPTPISEYLECLFGPDYMIPMTDFTRPPNFRRNLDATIRAKMEEQNENT